MNQVEIKATIDASNPQQLTAAISFLNSLGNGAEIPQSPGPAPEKQTPKKKEPAKRKSAAAKKETPKKEEPAQEAEEAKDDIKIEDVRSLLAKKVGDHRTEIKAKLTELGANNVTSLDKSKYPEFTEFLNRL